MKEEVIAQMEPLHPDESQERVESLLRQLKERPDLQAEISRQVNLLSPEEQVQFALGWVQPEWEGAEERIEEGIGQAAPALRSGRGAWTGALTLAAAAWLSLSPAQAQRAESVSAPDTVLMMRAAAESEERWRSPLTPTPEQLAVLGYRGVPGAENIQVSDPRFAERLVEMAQKSPFVRTRLQQLGQRGVTVYVLTPEEVPVIWPDLPLDLKEQGFWLGAAYMAEETGPLTRAMVILDLAELERVYTARGASEQERNEDLEALLGHELISHLGSTAESGLAESYCLDPTSAETVVNEGLFACSMQEDNRIRRELGTSLGERETYMKVKLHYERMLAEWEEEKGREMLRLWGLPIPEEGESAPASPTATSVPSESAELGMYARLNSLVASPGASAQPLPFSPAPVQGRSR